MILTSRKHPLIKELRDLRDKPNPELLFLEGPKLVEEALQPGTVAAILRTAEAAGAAGIITTPGTARLTSPKALRGAMGSSLRLPAIEHVPVGEITYKVPHAGYVIYGTFADIKRKPHDHLMI